jgi:hypothetical protein
VAYEKHLFKTWYRANCDFSLTKKYNIVVRHDVVKRSGVGCVVWSFNHKKRWIHIRRTASRIKYTMATSFHCWFSEFILRCWSRNKKKRRIHYSLKKILKSIKLKSIIIENQIFTGLVKSMSYWHL